MTSGSSGRGKLTLRHLRKLRLNRARCAACFFFIRSQESERGAAALLSRDPEKKPENKNTFRKEKLTSIARSSCSLSGAPNCRTDSCRFTPQEPPPSAAGSAAQQAANLRISSKSREISAAAPGCRTLTATTSPRLAPAALAPASDSVARCTCATDPEATGSRSNVSKTVESGPPKAASTAATDAAAACRGASDCSLRSALVTCGGNRSPRVAAHWPHLMKAGPAAASVDASSELQPSSSEESFLVPESRRTSGSAASAGAKSSARNSARPQVAASSASAASARESEAASGVRPRRESAEGAASGGRDARAGTRGRKKSASLSPKEGGAEALFFLFASKQAATLAPRPVPPPIKRAVGTATARFLYDWSEDERSWS